MLFENARLPSRAGLIWGHVMEGDTLKRGQAKWLVRSRIWAIFRNYLKQSWEMYQYIPREKLNAFLGRFSYFFAPTEL